MKKIEGSPKNLKQLLQNTKYSIHYYQREYMSKGELRQLPGDEGASPPRGAIAHHRNADYWFLRKAHCTPRGTATPLSRLRSNPTS